MRVAMSAEVERSERNMSTERSTTVEAVRLMYVAHAGDIHVYAARRVGTDLADDIVADTFRHAIESFESFDSNRGGARGWLFGIATNLLRHHWRTEQRRRAALERIAGPDTGETDSDPLLSVSARLDGATEVGRVLDAVAMLSREDHELLVLVAWEQMSRDDVADVLGVPSGTVRSRLHRIRHQLDTARRGPIKAAGQTALRETSPHQTPGDKTTDHRTVQNETVQNETMQNETLPNETLPNEKGAPA
jgi:RNA polymerase sigma factor (sigma-70 family)